MCVFREDYAWNSAIRKIWLQTLLTSPRSVWCGNTRSLVGHSHCRAAVDQTLTGRLVFEQGRQRAHKSLSSSWIEKEGWQENEIMEAEKYCQFGKERQRCCGRSPVFQFCRLFPIEEGQCIHPAYCGSVTRQLCVCVCVWWEEGGQWGTSTCPVRESVLLSAWPPGKGRQATTVMCTTRDGGCCVAHSLRWEAQTGESCVAQPGPAYLHIRLFSQFSKKRDS